MTVLVEFAYDPTGVNNIAWSGVTPGSGWIQPFVITDYVTNVSVSRGKQNYISNYNAATATVSLMNVGRVFDPAYVGSPFYGSIVPMGKLRISDEGVVQFIGDIQDWNFSYSVDGMSTAEVMASDGLAQLANYTFPALTTWPQELTGARIARILTAMGWPSDKRSIATGVNRVDAVDIDAGTNVLETIQLVEKSEGGRFYIDKNGNAVFHDRRTNVFGYNSVTTQQNICVNPNFETGTTFWTLAGSSLPTRVTTSPYKGTYCMNIPKSSSISYSFVAPAMSTFRYRMFTRATGTLTGSITVTLDVYDKDTFVGTISKSHSGTTSWDRKNNTITLPSYSTYSPEYTVKMTITNNLATGSVAFVDAVSIVFNPSTTLYGDGYFDGSYGPTNIGDYIYSYSWDNV